MTPQTRFMTEIHPHHSKLMQFALRLTGNRDDACDVLQNSYINALRHIDTFDGRNPKSWMYRIINNQFVNQYRHDKYIRMQTEIEPGHASYAPVEYSVSDQMKEALESLPKQCKSMVCLRFINGYSYEEIALLLNIPIGTVRSRISRSREHLKNQLNNNINGYYN